MSRQAKYLLQTEVEFLSCTPAPLKMDMLWPILFPIIISLLVEISDNPTKRLDYFRFSGKPFQRFELREARIEKRENFRLFRPCLI